MAGDDQRVRPVLKGPTIEVLDEIIEEQDLPDYDSAVRYLARQAGHDV